LPAAPVACIKLSRFFFCLVNEQAESASIKGGCCARSNLNQRKRKKVLWPRFGALIRRLIPAAAAGMDESNKTQSPPPPAAGPSDVELKVDQNESDNGSLSGMRLLFECPSAQINNQSFHLTQEPEIQSLGHKKK
jgi:hypothetical protein